MPEGFVEQLYRGIHYGFDGTKINVGLKGDRTPYQMLHLYDTPVLGKVLLLDSKVQFTELDEHRYHETMAHWPVHAVGFPRHVLIVDGGDLGVARELTKYPFIEYIDVVDIDSEVTRVTRDYVPNICGDALRDHRVRLGHQDAAVFVREQCDERYDIIICDTTDETDVALRLYTKEFVVELYRLLKQGGVIVRVAGALDLQRAQVRETTQQMCEVFGREMTTVLLLGLVCYQGGYFALSVSKKTDMPAVWTPTRHQRSIATTWYDEEVHEKINFGTCKFIKETLLA